MSWLRPLVATTLRSRPLRPVLTAAAVLVGTATVLGVEVAVDALDRQAAGIATARAGISDLDVRSVAGAGLAPEDIARLGSLNGVDEVAPLQEKRVTAVAGGGTPVTVIVAGVDGAGRVALRPVRVVAGRLPRPVTSGRREVALDTGVAQALAAGGPSVTVGSTVSITTASGPDGFTVTGLTAGTTGGSVLTRSTAFVTARDAAGPFALGLHVPLAALRLAPGTAPEVVARDVRTALGATARTTDPRSGVTDPLRGLGPLLAFVVVLSVLLGAGVCAVSVAVATVERRRDIGLLRAVGASQRQVVTLLVSEVLLAATVGTVVGIAAGTAVGALVARASAADGTEVPAAAPGAVALVVAIGAGLGAGLLGALPPAISAARIPVLDAVRRGSAGAPRRPGAAVLVGPPVAGAALAAVLMATGGAASVVVGTVALLLTVGAVTVPRATALTTGLGRLANGVLPRAPVAAANLARRRLRAGLVVAALAVAVATTISVTALDAGAQDAGDAWVGHLFAGDMVLVSPATGSDAVADQVATRSGLPVGRMRFLAADIGGTAVGLCALDTALLRDHGGLDVVAGDRTAALTRLAAGPAVLVPRDLADANGWGVGTLLPLDAGTGGSPVLLTVAAVVDHGYPSGDGREGLVIDRAQAVSILGPTAGGFDDLQVVAGVRSGDVARLAAEYGMQATSVASIRDAARGALGRTLAILTGLSVAAVVLALLAVATTLATDVRLSTRDLALLRAAGLSRAATVRLVLQEAGLLAVAGLCVGAFAGAIATLALVHAAATPGFTPALSVPLTATVVLAATVLVVSLAAALPPARRAAGTAIVAAIGSE